MLSMMNHHLVDIHNSFPSNHNLEDSKLLKIENIELFSFIKIYEFSNCEIKYLP